MAYSLDSVTTFHCEGMLPWQEDHFDARFQVGDGFLDVRTEGRRFRVIDVWYSTDRRGAFDMGRHVFLRDVTETEDDRLYALEPGYFTPVEN